MNGKISNVPALTKYKGIDIQLSHLTCSGPPFLCLLCCLYRQWRAFLCHSGRPSSYQTRNSQTRWKRLLLEEKQFVVLFLHKKVHLSAKSACQETIFKYKIVLVWFCVCVPLCSIKKMWPSTAIKCKVL